MDDVLEELLHQINKAKSNRFTGKMTVTLHMSCGGIGQVALNMEQNLKTLAKSRDKSESI